MVAACNHTTFNLNPRASSIDTPLHSFIPAKFVDHMHPNAIIAIAASANCEKLTQEILGGEMAYVTWMRPGFELGLAMQSDERLVSMLARIYDSSYPGGETGRATSAADIERNRAPTGLARADLSWRTLLCALPGLPPLVSRPFGSDLLPAQGIGILRREGDAVYVSLDYGHSGGGHGHPDRLNLTLVDRTHRWFEDPGTGSYVDPSLHWYRSTLAHNAPLMSCGALTIPLAYIRFSTSDRMAHRLA